MSDEPIVISVMDGVSPNVAISLRKIATEALAAHTTVDLLQKALNSMKVGSTASLSAVVSDTNKLVEANNRLAQSQNKVKDSSNLLSGSLSSLKGYLITYFGVNELKQYADEYTRATGLVNIFSHSQAETAAVMAKLFDVAQSTRQSLDGTVKTYHQLTIAGAQLGATQNQMIAVSGLVGKAFAIQGTPTNTAKAGILQLSHAMTEGIVRGRQFNSLLIEMPRVLQVVADHIEGAGGSTAKLRQMMLEGKLTSKAFFDAAVAGSKDLDGQFDKTGKTIAQAFTYLRNALVQYVGQANQASGASAALFSIMKFTADNVDVLVKAVMVLGSAYLVTGIANLTKAMIAFDIAAAANPLGIVLALVAGAAAAFALFGDNVAVATANLQAADIGTQATHLEGFSRSAKNSSEQMDNLVVGIAQIDTSKIDAAGTATIAFQNHLVDTNKLTISFKDKVMGYFDAMAGSFRALGDDLVAIWDSVINYFKTHELIPQIKKPLMAIGDFLTGGMEKTPSAQAAFDANVAADKAAKLAADNDPASFKNIAAAAARKRASDRKNAEDAAKAQQDIAMNLNLNVPLGIPQDFTHGKPKSNKRAENELENLRKLNETLKLEKAHQFDIADARERQVKLGELDIKYGNLKGKTAKDLLESAKSLTAQKLTDQKIQQAMDAAAAGGTKANLEDYANKTAGINQAMKNGSLTVEERNVELNKLNETYKNAKNPILDYIETLQIEHDKMQNLGHEGGVINKVNDELKKLGLTGDNLTEGQKNQAKWIDAKIHSLDKESMVYAEQNRILAETVDIYGQLAARQEALNTLKTNPNISDEYKQREQAKLNIDSANTRLNSANYGDQLNDPQRNMDILTSAGGKLLEGYKGVAVGISEAFGQTFTTLKDGFADAFANAIVKGDSLKDSLRNVAITIETQLISSLIKMGVQWLVNAAIGTAANTSASAALVADGIAVAAAWAPAEAAVSLASFGANSIPAIAGISATHGLSEALAIAGMAHDGIDNIPREGTWLLDKGERVVDQRTNGDLKNFLSNNSRGNTSNVTNNNTTQSSGQAINVHVYNTGLDDAIVDWHNDSASDHVIVNKMDRNSSKISRVLQNG